MLNSEDPNMSDKTVAKLMCILVDHGEVEFVKECLQSKKASGVKIPILDKGMRSILHTLIERGYARHAKSIIANNETWIQNIAHKNCSKIMCTLVSRGEAEFVTEILQNKSEKIETIKDSDNDLASILCALIKHGKSEAVKKIINNENFFEKISSHHYTKLMLAFINYGELESVKKLLQKKNFFLSGCYGNLASVLRAFIEHGEVEFAKNIVMNNETWIKNISAYECSKIMCTFLNHGEVEFAKNIVMNNETWIKNVSAYECSKIMCTFLNHGHVEFVKELLQNRILEKKSCKGFANVLCAFVNHDKIAFVKRILQKKTTLLAIINNLSSILRTLVKHNNFGFTVAKKIIKSLDTENANNALFGWSLDEETFEREDMRSIFVELLEKCSSEKLGKFVEKNIKKVDFELMSKLISRVSDFSSIEKIYFALKNKIPYTDLLHKIKIIKNQVMLNIVNNVQKNIDQGNLSNDERILALGKTLTPIDWWTFENMVIHKDPLTVKRLVDSAFERAQTAISNSDLSKKQKVNFKKGFFYIRNGYIGNIQFNRYKHLTLLNIVEERQKEREFKRIVIEEFSMAAANYLELKDSGRLSDYKNRYKILGMCIIDFNNIEFFHEKYPNIFKINAEIILNQSKSFENIRVNSFKKLSDDLYNITKGIYDKENNIEIIINGPGKFNKFLETVKKESERCHFKDIVQKELDKAVSNYLQLNDENKKCQQWNPEKYYKLCGVCPINFREIEQFTEKYSNVFKVFVKPSVDSNNRELSMPSQSLDAFENTRLHSFEKLVNDFCKNKEGIRNIILGEGNYEKVVQKMKEESNKKLDVGNVKSPYFHLMNFYEDSVTQGKNPLDTPKHLIYKARNFKKGRCLHGLNIDANWKISNVEGLHLDLPLPVSMKCEFTKQSKKIIQYQD
ncbi:ankyrin repeats (3 copies) [Holospora obtusa F1]|uniref:Ankyrin repeats (3 copies) n=2 Tax=Holospora obtusa TaxID=49893 RepID=W6TF33_HOLOB|nr:ankyrin repeats (3 copies) [Holospora obtusa F1]